jgi:pimeloyl-ACP methyl ester carboxylesterase
MQVNQQCNLAYAVYEPDTMLSDVEVLLAHGFMRSIDDMAETAEHIASWGVKVYAVPLCTNTFNINHQLNGEAIAALGEALAPAGAVYSGFSAGGLAAFVAAVNADNVVGYVGLDAVDNADLGLGMAGQLDAPARGSIANAGQCNTNNNFLPVYDMVPNAPVMRIVGAQHFDFEAAACGLGDIACGFCAPAGPETRALALGMSTAAILIETGADLGGYTWWGPGGSYFDMYAQQGKIMLIP